MPSKRILSTLLSIPRATVKSRFIEMFGDCTVHVSLGEVCLFKSGKTLPKEKEMPSGDYLYAKVGDLNLPGNERTIRFSRSYVDAATAKRSLIPKGAVVFPKRGGAIGTNKKRITGEDCCLDLNLMSVIPGEKIHTEYLLAWFEQMDLADIANGSTVPQINNKDLNPLTIALPKMELQQEFADFVSQVDKLRYLTVCSACFLFSSTALRMQLIFLCKLTGKIGIIIKLSPERVICGCAEPDIAFLKSYVCK